MLNERSMNRVIVHNDSARNPNLHVEEDLALLRLRGRKSGCVWECRPETSY